MDPTRLQGQRLRRIRRLLILLNPSMRMNCLTRLTWLWGIRSRTIRPWRCTMTDPGALVYVVDDDASVREGVARLIRSAGLMAKTFASGEEFLDTSRPEVPNCLVLDMDLPGLTGLDLQQELARANVRIPIIFLTGHGDIPTTVRAIKAGALEFLTKPFDDEALLDAIRRGIAIDQSALQQSRNPTLRTNLKEFHPFKLDTVNQCL